MTKPNTNKWEIEFDNWWDGHIKKIGGGEERGIAYQDTKLFFSQSRQEFAEELLKEVEGLKVDEKIEEHSSQEEKELMVKILGECNTPEFLSERRYGWNKALDQVLSILKDKK